LQETEVALTNIDICSNALVAIGASPISSFSDGTTESTVASNLYETTVRVLLSRHRWRFAMRMVQASRLSDEPPAEYSAAYQIPSDMLLVETVQIAGDPIEFDRFEDKIYCDAGTDDEVFIEGVYRIDESQWPYYFVDYLIYELASKFAISVAAQTETADYFRRLADRAGSLARNLDSQARTTQKIDLGGIIRNRFR